MYGFMLSSAVLNLDYPVLGTLEREMFGNVDICLDSGLKSLNFPLTSRRVVIYIFHGMRLTTLCLIL